MLPRDLKPDHFRAYPPAARKLALDSLPTLQRLPLSFLPNLLRELIEYDYKFPVERLALEKENRELRMKAEFLGKAAAFFAQESR